MSVTALEISRKLQISNKPVVFLKHSYWMSILQIGMLDKSLAPISRTLTYIPNPHICGSKGFNGMIPVHNAHAYVFISEVEQKLFIHGYWTEYKQFGTIIPESFNFSKLVICKSQGKELKL